MSFLRSKRGLLAVTAGVVFALFVIRPGAGGVKDRVVRALSLGLGRQVEIESLSVRLLPWPGFELYNFVIHDDPAFSAEPMLRAQKVAASLRVMSLVRGHFEISRLALTEPSLNVARNSQGHWNLEDLLQHAARTPSAPTGKNKSERRIAFPYIQADRARINFKIGMEKKSYALTEADFSLWQDSENQWSMRLKARPVRTDFNLTDTGILNVNGSWQRAGSLRETPLQFKLEWTHAQLGQASKLAYGNDRGWRGGIAISAVLSGKPADVLLDTNLAVQDFHRFGVSADAPVNLAAQCGSRYSSVDHSLSNIVCRAPVGPGFLSLEGKMASLLRPRSYYLLINAQDLPVASVLALVRHCKQNFPEALTAAGILNGQAAITGTQNKAAAWLGGGSVTNVRLGAKANPENFLVGTVPFTIAPASHLPEGRKQPLQRKVSQQAETEAGTRLNFGPVNLALGRSSPARVMGSISRASYDMTMQGNAEVRSILQLVKMTGVATPLPSATGSVTFDVRMAGNWRTDDRPHPVGEAQLRSVRAEGLGINQPLEITSANLLLKPDELAVPSLSVSLAGSVWRGSLAVPLHCAEPGSCSTRFELHSSRVQADELNETFNPLFAKRPWYRFLASSQSRRPYLLSLNAKGTLSADRITFKNQVATGVSANIDWSHGKLHASKLQGFVFGGTHSGDWRGDFTVQPPEYTGTGELEQINLEQVAQLSHSAWVTGIAAGKYRITFAGLNAAQLTDSADAVLQFQIAHGSFPHVKLSPAEPLAIQGFVGSLSFRDNKFEISQGKLETESASYQVTGTASAGKSFLGQGLNLKLAGNGTPGFIITGTLAEPRVAPAAASETRAALKP